MQKEKWKNKLPDNYYAQCIHYLMITGYEFVVLVAQLKSDFNGEIYKQVKHYKIERSEVQQDIEFLEEKERVFWACVQNNVRPNLVLPEI